MIQDNNIPKRMITMASNLVKARTTRRRNEEQINIIVTCTYMGTDRENL